MLLVCISSENAILGCFLRQGDVEAKHGLDHDAPANESAELTECGASANLLIPPGNRSQLQWVSRGGNNSGSLPATGCGAAGETFRHKARAGIISSIMEITGCGTAIVTPFRANGSIDEAALWALVNWQIDSGIDFLVACGSTGEAATLDEDEWLTVVRIVVEAAAGRVPVWAGCTHNSTRTLLRLAGLLSRMKGVSAVLSANPYYNKPTQEGQFQHFLALARAVDPLPVALYNVPGRTAANLEPETVARLAATASNIQAIKEASGKLPQISPACAYAASRLQDLLRRRQYGFGRHRRGRERADQRRGK